ncbi:MAG: dihydroneopterin aldolase [Nanoarchaeota archaeon]
MDKIIIKNANFSVNIGVSEEERKKKQDIFIDVLLYSNIQKPASTDNIEDTINYSRVCKCIREIFEAKEYRLIETVSEIIAKTLLSAFAVNKVEIRIKKPDAVKIADYAGVEIVRQNAKLYSRFSSS